MKVQLVINCEMQLSYLIIILLDRSIIIPKLIFNCRQQFFQFLLFSLFNSNSNPAHFLIFLSFCHFFFFPSLLQLTLPLYPPLVSYFTEHMINPGSKMHYGKASDIIPYHNCSIRTYISNLPAVASPLFSKEKKSTHHKPLPRCEAFPSCMLLVITLNY